MRETEHEVYLISKPHLDWNEMARYLKSIDAESWAESRYGEVGTPDEPITAAQTLVEFAGRACYRSWEPGLNKNVTRTRANQYEYLDNINKVGHGSVLEHANFSFMLQNVSRVVTHELVRHRAGAAYSQESLRFVRLDDIPFWFPEWAKDDPEFMERALPLLQDMEAFQLWMADHFKLDDEGVPFSEKKHKTSFMRRFAPIGLTTSIVFTANVRALRHIITMRTALGAEEEIRLIFGRVAEIMVRECPAMFGDFEKNDDGEWVTPYVKV